MSDAKSKQDRTKEGIHLLRQLIDTGVDTADADYIALKERISDWVKTGDAWTGKINFTAYGRVAEILLPRRANAVATLAFKMKPGH
jgi:hypothetical protein